MIRQQVGPSGGPLGPAEQLQALAKLCFSRALGACWLIPCMDLIVRVKLNLIGDLEGFEWVRQYDNITWDQIRGR